MKLINALNLDDRRRDEYLDYCFLEMGQREGLFSK